VGDAGDETADELHREALAAFIPRRAIQIVRPEELGDQALPAALKDMVVASRATRGYACTGFTCSQPASDLSSWRATLESLRPAVSV
jgi:uncharacterized protein YyaL (SSP411 family)